MWAQINKWRNFQVLFNLPIVNAGNLIIYIRLAFIPFQKSAKFSTSSSVVKFLPWDVDTSLLWLGKFNFLFALKENPHWIFKSGVKGTSENVLL